MATTSPAQTPTLAELLDRIDEIRPILAAHAEKTEEGRRLPGANVQALADAGAFKVTVPRRFGGYQMGAGLLE